MDGGERVRGLSDVSARGGRGGEKSEGNAKESCERSVHIGPYPFHMQILDLTKVRLNNVAAAAPATRFYFTVQRASNNSAGPLCPRGP